MKVQLVTLCASCRWTFLHLTDRVSKTMRWRISRLTRNFTCLLLLLNDLFGPKGCSSPASQSSSAWPYGSQADFPMLGLSAIFLKQPEKFLFKSPVQCSPLCCCPKRPGGFFFSTNQKLVLLFFPIFKN